MVEPAPGLVTPPAALAAVVAPWVESLQRECQGTLRAVYLHGSALAPHFEAKRSDVNLLVVVSELPFQRLSALRRRVRRQRRRAPPRVLPLVLTEAQVRNSQDTFPAEFLDLQARRALLAGTDLLADLVIARHHLRHQCEYELRAKLVGLRQAYLLDDGGADLALRLLARASGALAAVLRALLVLRREAPPDDPAALAGAVARLYGVDATALAAPVRARAGACPDPDAALASLLETLSALIEAVDVEPKR